jgi:UTP--glucose-1-phosphate uridylyltransferase
VKIRKAVFPAAGFGTRFLPATKASPKEMLPLVDKPLIQHGVEEARASGIRDMIIVTGRGKNAIEDHFDVAFELEATLEKKGDAAQLAVVRGITDMADFFYVRQHMPLGLGHAVLRAKDIVGEEPFAVILADDVIDSRVPVLRQMIDVYERHGGDAVLAIQRVPRDQVSRYGIIKGKRLAPGVYEVLDMVEKPKPARAPSDLAVIGRYILPPSIFPALEATRPGSGGEIQLTDAIRSLLATERVIGYEFEGVRYDAGNKLGFLMANVAFALKDPEIGPGLRLFMGKGRKK